MLKIGKIYSSSENPTIRTGMEAGTKPDFRMIRWPLSPVIKDAKPVPSPARASRLIIKTSLRRG
jgi:hypothetical protein